MNPGPRPAHGTVSCSASRPLPRRGRAGLRFLFITIPALFLSFRPGGAAFAFDGRVEFRANTQEGRAGEQAYRTSTRWEEGSLQQRLDVTTRLWMQGRIRVLREIVESRFEGVDTDVENRTVQPAASIGFATKRLRLGMNVDGYRRESSGSAGSDRTLDRVGFGGSALYRGEGTTRIGLRYGGVESSREEEGFPGQEVRERTSTVHAERSFSHVGRLKYQFSNLTSDAGLRDTRTTHTTHGLEYSGDSRFAGDRGNAFLRARSMFFTQRVRSGGEALESIYLLPLAGGVLLDDTPDVLDPLEPERTPVPELFDRDRGAPTSIDLGDDAPVVREFGGDYRNIELDFGESATIASAFLYIDRILLNPELYSWRIFTTDDPEGRIWEELDTGAYAITYREVGTGLQGWEIVLTDSVSARFFKMVDLKLGPSVPQLLVTELELYGPSAEGRVETEDWTNTHRIDGSIGYAITDALRVRYNGSYRQRDYSEKSRNLVERSHGLSAGLVAWRFLFTGQYDIHTLGGPTRRGIDVDNSLLSVRYEAGPAFSTTAAWTRTLDTSSGRDRTTDNYALSTAWRIAPGLTIDQRVTEGRLIDRAEGRESSSTAVLTAVRAEPVRTLGVDLERTDRWVDREAGSGFTRFNDTALTLAWTPVPNVSVHSLFRYEERERSDWIVQQLFMWEPFAGGQVRPRFTLNHFRDTRNETEQRGAGIGIVWRSGRLTVEGNGDYQDLRFEGARNRPTNGGVRVVWTF